MSTEHQEPMVGTKPIKEHAWLENLIGNWKIESEMAMAPGEPTVKSEGTASVTSFGGLWAYMESEETMPNGNPMTSKFALGYDVTFKEYRACWISSVSSHLWTYKGTLSGDGKTMTLDCEGPSMVNDGTALYRDTIELIDDNHQVRTSYGQDENGEWQVFITARYTRV